MAKAPETPKAVAVPLASLQPAPWNPRSISDERFQNLCRSIETDRLAASDPGKEGRAERALRDNARWGEWEVDDLEALLEQLSDGGTDLDLPGFGERDLQNRLKSWCNDGTAGYSWNANQSGS